MHNSWKKLICLAMSAVMVASMSVAAFAAEGDEVATGNQNAGVLTSGQSESTIPVTISAEATVFDVTVPTAFPTVVDPETGETKEGDPIITNNSYGSIVVSNITVKDNATESAAATWHLADFDKDMSKVEVDANLIGISIAPRRGDKDEAGTLLKTVDGDPESQVLLNARSEEWTLNGNTAKDGSNELHVVYDTNVSAVSTKITNLVAANIVITIAWNTVQTTETTD